MSQARHWVFTLNNYTDGDLVSLRALATDCTYLVFGRETGESGTPHLQGYVDFGTSKRFAVAKQLIGGTSHIEVKRGSCQQAADYCKKDADFEEYGTISGGQGKRTDWDLYIEWVTELGRIPGKRELIRNFPSLYARYSSRCYEIAEAFTAPPSLTTGDPRLGFQTLVVGRAGGVPNARSIDFVVDPEGNSGKTWLCQYLLTRWPDRTQVMRVGRRDDLAYCIDPSKDIFCFDVPRTQMEYFPYPVLEMLKDQMIFSPKYKSRMQTLTHVPYVVVFTNEEPDRNKLTSDRFNIINV